MRISLAALVVLLLWGACAPAGAATRLTEIPSDGGATYRLDNGAVSVAVLPADGAAVVLRGSPAGGSGHLVRDVYLGRPCRYRLADLVRSDSLAVLRLHWESVEGLEVVKTISVLDGVRLVRVDYEVTNASGSDATLGTGFRFGATAPDGRVVVRHAGGQMRGTAEELPDASGASFRSVAWFALTAPGGDGLAVVARGGALSQLDLQRPGPDEMVANGWLRALPEGRVLRTRLTLVPVEHMEGLVSASESHLCAVGMEHVANACRISLQVLPLLETVNGRARLELADPTGAVLSIDAGRLTLAVGRPTPMTLHWGNPKPGVYDMRLLLPGLPAPLVLGRCRIAADGPRLEPSPGRPVGLGRLGTVRPRAGQGGAAGPESRADMFYGGPSERLSVVRTDLGVDETETLVVGVSQGLTGGPLEARLSRFVARQMGRELSSSAWEFLRIVAARAADSTHVPGSVTAAGAGPVQTGSPVGLRLRSPNVHAATYAGHLEVRRGRENGSLPIEATIWPVRRLRPGAVRLYLMAPRVDPFQTDWRADIPTAALRRAEVANVALDADSVAHGDAVRVLPETGPAVPVRRWMRDRSASEAGGALPALDFSAATARLTRLLVAGLPDVTVAGRLTPDGLLPPEAPPGERGRMLEWYWGAFAEHLRSLGFDRLCFVSPEPYGVDDAGAGWLETAHALRSAGWSVCGPFEPGSLTPAMVDRLADLTDLVLLRADAPGAVEAAAALAGRVRLGAWAPGLPADISAHEGRLHAYRWATGDADTIVLDQPNRPALQSTDDLRALDTLAWEGFRDGLDEVCYAALLGGPRTARMEDVPAKREVLAQISASAPEGGLREPNLRWRDLTLVEAGKPRAAIAVDWDSPVQNAQADLLNALVRRRCGGRLPVVGLGEIGPTPEAPVVLLFGAPETNGRIADLAADAAPRLSERLRRDRYACVEFRRQGVRFVGLLNAADADHGLPVLAFCAGFRQETGAEARGASRLLREPGTGMTEGSRWN
ncbi:MAG: YidC/Oxa1 family membrane protein insertase [Candidatus Brocadiaceae bacterium]|nr:YidC/Oxa1 family membrane protein insertase [Candidatus Brocadiaceae bacterium]